MSHHWSFLENKLGQDIVRFCVQPFLLPFNGMDMCEKRWLVIRELDTTFDYYNRGYDRDSHQTIIHMMKFWHQDECCDLHAPRMKRRIANKCIGSEMARWYKHLVLKDIRQIYVMKLLNPNWNFKCLTSIA